MTNLTWDNQEPQECPDHREIRENRVHLETEGLLEYQETWDPLVSLVLKVHLVLLVRGASKDQRDCQDSKESRALQEVLDIQD